MTREITTEEEALILARSKPQNINDVPAALRTEAVCLAAVQMDGRALAVLSDTAQTTRLTAAVCAAAIRQNPGVLGEVPADRMTEAMAVAGVRHKGSLIAKVPDHLKTEAVCTAAVEQDGWALSYVPEHMRTEALCLIAVQHAGANLRHVPVALRSPAICLTAMRAGAADAIAAVPVELRTESIWLELMRQTNYAPHDIAWLTSTEIQSIKRDLMQWNGLLLGELKEDARTLKLCQAAVGQNPEALKFVPEKWRAQLGPKLGPPTAISDDLQSLVTPLQTGPWASVI
jgi:hypothetical protein